MEEGPKIKTKFETIDEEMRLKGFNYYRTDGLYETRGVSSKDNNNEPLMFKMIQIETEESLINKYKNLPEFAEVKDEMEVKLVEDEKDEGIYYIFIKVN